MKIYLSKETVGILVNSIDPASALSEEEFDQLQEVRAEIIRADESREKDK